MDPTTLAAFTDELEKIAKKIKSNDRMPSRSKANIEALSNQIKEMDPKHRKPALAFTDKVTAPKLFEVLHSMRRWYSGQTMGGKLVGNRDVLKKVMKLEPEDALGVFRGFKVSKDNPLAKATVGQRLTIPVTRNKGLSSWSTTEGPTHRFSGSSKGKVGLVIKLVGKKGITPILAPPEKTKDWFNALYAHTMSTSFRPTEGEYLISAPSVEVEVVRVKK